MSKQRWRDEFLVAAGKAGLTAYDARRLLSAAATLDHLAVAQCNGDWPADHGDAWPTTPCPSCTQAWHAVAYRWKDKRCPDCHAEDRVRTILNGSGIVPEFAGDPRGCVLKLKLKDGRELGVPS